MFEIRKLDFKTLSERKVNIKLLMREVPFIVITDKMN